MAAVNSVEAERLIRQVLSVNHIPYLKGSPGTGKSKLIQSIFDDFQLKMIDHRISGAVPEDFTGLPRFGEKKAEFVPFDLFPLESDPIPDGYQGWGIFLDEYNSGETQVMAATYKLLLDRMVNQTPLHTNVAIALAGNLDTDKAITNYVSSAIKSRVITIELMSHYPSWKEKVGIPHNYDPRIMSFLECNPDRLNNFAQNPEADSYACERTWEFMNDLIKHHLPLNSTEDTVSNMYNLFFGTIGIEAANFIAFIKNFNEVVPLRDILGNPETARIPDSQALKYHTISNLCQNVNDETFGKIIKYVLRFSLSYQFIFFQTVVKRFPNFRTHTEFRQGVIAVSNYLKGMGDEFGIEV